MKTRQDIHDKYLVLDQSSSRTKIYKTVQTLLFTIITLILITTNLYADYIPNQIIVKYKNGIAATRSITISSSRHVMKQNSVPTYLIENTFLLETTDNVTNSIEMLQSDPDIEYAEPNYIVYTRLAPNDPKYKSNSDVRYQFRKDSGINAEIAWDTITDSSDISVVILDTGIDLDHEDLIDNIDKINGYDATENTSGVDSANDLDGHGTHVAGIVGATGNNSLGSTGIAWKSNLIGIKVLSGKSGTVSDVIKGINHAIKIKARIINASLGGPPNQLSQAEYDAVKKAVDNGIVFIAAAGNDRSNTDYSPEYPAAYAIRGVISVGASDDRSAVAIWSASQESSIGRTSIHLFAPGTAIVSTWIGDDYKSLSGTSMATPMVTGAVSLLLAQKPYLTPSQVEQLLINSVREDPYMKQKAMSEGILDLDKLLKFDTNTLFDAPINFAITKIGGTNASVNLNWKVDPNAEIEIYAKSTINDEFQIIDRLRSGTYEYIDQPIITQTDTRRYYRIRALKDGVYTPFIQINNRKFTNSEYSFTPEFLRLSPQNNKDRAVTPTPQHTPNINPSKLLINMYNLDFGVVTIKESPEDRTVNVKNNGDTNFTIKSMDTTNLNFQINPETTTCSNGQILAITENCNITVRFTPQQPITTDAILKIKTDLRNKQLYIVNLTGKGESRDLDIEKKSNKFVGGCSIGSNSDHLFMLLLLILIIKSIAIFKRVSRT